MKKKNLCIMYGGPGEEHKVSIKSAENIISNIDKNKYNLKIIFLEKNKKESESLKVKMIEIVKNLKKENFLVWPIFHGEFGEGGYLQAILEKCKIKFIGSKSSSAKVSMDKLKTQKILEKNKIRVPKTILIDKNEFDFNKLVHKINKLKFNYPLILKPFNGGSSIDLYKIKTPSNLQEVLNKILINNSKVLLQECVQGREFTCGILQNKKKKIVLPATEIILTKTDTFDYSAKYSVGGCVEVTPANIDKEMMQKIQKISLKVHKLLNCKDISRVDMILNNKNELVVLEINTMPGMTKTSFIPQQLLSHGITIPRFIDMLVENNLQSLSHI